MGKCGGSNNFDVSIASGRSTFNREDLENKC